MQKRHFETIAGIIASIPDATTRDNIARQFADALPQWNPQFNRTRFLSACNAADADAVEYTIDGKRQRLPKAAERFAVEIIGSYDSVMVFPFASMAEAEQHAAIIPDNFDAYPMTETAMNDSMAEFGAVEIMSPEASRESIKEDSEAEA